MAADLPAFRSEVQIGVQARKTLNNKVYESLVGRIFSNGNQTLWFQALSLCASLLTKECAELVERAVKFDWTISMDVAQEYANFVLNLVSAQGSWTTFVVEVLVSGLLPSGVSSDPARADAIFTRIHQILSAILTLVPTATKPLYEHLRSYFPYSARDIEVHAVYVTNLLHVISYAPLLRERILALLVDKMVEIDVQIFIDDEDALGAELVAAETARTQNEETMFEVEIEGDVTAPFVPVESNIGPVMTPSECAAFAAKHTRRDDVHVMADKLDILMELVLQHLHASCGPRSHDEVKLAVFDCMLHSFDQFILNTHRSKYSQFLMFYLCSLDRQFTDAFLVYLHNILFDASQPVLTRRICAGYISSFLSRASFVPMDLVMQSIRLMAGYMGSHINETSLNASQSDSDAGSFSQPTVLSNMADSAEIASAHGVFYSVCQALLYMLCFRQPALCAMPQGMEFLHSLQLRHILSSHLSPLLVVSNNVSKQFLKIFHPLGLADYDCLTAVEGQYFNLSIRPLAMSLESFFPFDPYLLRNSYHFIHNIYLKWTDVHPEDEDEDYEESDSEDESSELAGSYMSAEMSNALSFTPDLEHDLSWHSKGSFGSKPKHKRSSFNNSIMRNVLVQSLCLAALGYLVYQNSLDPRAEFVLDDQVAILRNAVVTGQAPIGVVWETDFWGTPLNASSSHQSYRPLSVLSFRWNYEYCGANAACFRLVNSILHIIMGIVLLGTNPFVLSSWGAFVSAALFLLHPIHTEVINSAVGRADLLCGLFFLLCLYTTARGLDESRIEVKCVHFAASASFLEASILSKETGITVVAVAVASAVVLCPGRLNSRRNIWFLGLLVSVAVLHLAVRWQISDAKPVFNFVSNPIAFADSFTKFLTYAYLHAYYAYLLIWPAHLCAEYSYNCIPLVTSLSDPRNLATIALYGSVATAALVLAKRLWAENSKQSTHFKKPVAGNAGEKVTKSRLYFGSPLLFMLAFAGLTFLPASNILFPIGTVVAERLLFLPSLAICAALAYLLVKLYDVPRLRLLSMAVIIAIATAYAVRVYTRNPEWLNNEELFQSGIRVCPANAKTQLSLAVLYGQERGNHERAIQYIENALKIHPRYCEAIYYRGYCFFAVGMNEAALGEYNRSAHCQPNGMEGQAFADMGSVYLSAKEYKKAQPLFQKAIEIESFRGPHWLNYGVSLHLDNKFKRAMVCYQTALQYDPTLVDAYNNLAIIYTNMNQLEQAVEMYRMALQIRPSYEKAIAGLDHVQRLQNKNGNRRAS